MEMENNEHMKLFIWWNVKIRSMSFKCNGEIKTSLKQLYQYVRRPAQAGENQFFQTEGVA